MDLKRTPLEEAHERLGAKLVPFAGWRMPLEYAGVLTEHRAVRETVGMFDLTHLGKIEVSGAGARARLQSVLSNDVEVIEPGGGQYNLVLTDTGGIVDDLIAYRTGDDRYLVVPNAANTDEVLSILRDGASGDVTVEHRPDLCTIAVQGPRSHDLLGPRFPAAEGLPFMSCVETTYGGGPVVVARSGYTGELGVELFVPAGAAPALWDDLIDAGGALGLEPCGLGARDTLRLEMGYPLHGNDISKDRTPLEAGLSWAVALDKEELRGRERLLGMKEEGIPARLRGLRMAGRLIPRAGYPVFVGATEVGRTTSGTFSPTLRVGIALAYLDPELQPGATVDVDVRGRRGEAEVVKPPFVDASPKEPGS